MNLVYFPKPGSFEPAVLLSVLKARPELNDFTDSQGNAQSAVRLRGSANSLEVGVPAGTPEQVVDTAIAAYPAALASWQADQAAASTAQANLATLQDRAVSALAQLKQADDNWGSLTAGQKDAALHLAVRVTAALARVQFGQLSST